jgi:hypothetical protein
MSGLGFNIDGMFTTNEDRNWLETELKSNPPNSLVVLSDINYAIRLKRNVGVDKTVLRLFWGNEFDNIYRTTSVNDYLYIYKDAIANNLILYSCNEPAEFINSNNVIMPNVELFTWEYELSRKILERNASAVQFNWSVGMPNEQTTNLAHWRKNLEIISKNKNQLFLGLHEYWFGWPFSEATNSASYTAMFNYNPPKTQKNFIIGRYRHILEYCRSNFNATPDIIFTEYGYDEVYALHHKIPFMHNYKLPYRIPNILPALNFWAGISGMEMYEYAFQQFRLAWDKIYKFDDEVKGVCFFPFGGIGAWDEMSIHRHKPLVSKLIKSNFNTIASPVIEDDIMLTNGEATRIVYTGVPVNLRTQPTTNSATKFTINSPVEMFLFENVFGYVAVSIVGFTKTPYDEPILSIDKNLINSKIDVIRDAISDIETEVNE